MIAHGHIINIGPMNERRRFVESESTLLRAAARAPVPRPRRLICVCVLFCNVLAVCFRKMCCCWRAGAGASALESSLTAAAVASAAAEERTRIRHQQRAAFGRDAPALMCTALALAVSLSTWPWHSPAVFFSHALVLLLAGVTLADRCHSNLKFCSGSSSDFTIQVTTRSVLLQTVRLFLTNCSYLQHYDLHFYSTLLRVHVYCYMVSSVFCTQHQVQYTRFQSSESCPHI